VIVEPAIARLEGNLAKQRVQRRLRELIGAQEGLSILDVGCVGPSPLSMWAWIFDDYGGRFHLTGVDVAGTERAARVAEEMGWRKTRFASIGRYDLSGRLGGEKFDVVVCTQVLEHVLRLGAFVADLARVIKPGGRALLTLDSAHFRRERSLPRAVAKWAVVRLGAERYHERGLRDETVELAFTAHGLRVVDRRYLNLHPLKWIHNHGVQRGRRDELASRWYELELMLNDDVAFVAANKHLFQDLYYELVATA
jgi:2-polyprenyl-3-methyl-5-hydroxy-6-metoxy-1,4-benzoquinol methylase